MLITVTTTSTGLDSLLTAQQVTSILQNRTDDQLTICIRNLGANTIYVDTDSTVSTSTGLDLATGDVATFEVPYLNSLKLISATSSNADVRVVVL